MPLRKPEPGHLTLLANGSQSSRLSLLCREVDARLRVDTANYALALCSANPASIPEFSRKIRKYSGQKRAGRYQVRDVFQVLEALQHAKKPLEPRLRIQLADILSATNERGFSASCQWNSVDDLLLSEPNSEFAVMYLMLLQAMNIRHPYPDIATTRFPDSVTDIYVHELDTLHPALIRWWVRQTDHSINVWASCADPNQITCHLRDPQQAQLIGTKPRHTSSKAASEHRAFPSSYEQSLAIIEDLEADTVFVLSAQSRMQLEWSYILSGHAYRIESAISVLSSPEVALLRSFLNWLTSRSQSALRHIMEELGVSPGAWVRFAKSQDMPVDPAIAAMSTKPAFETSTPILDRFSRLAKLVQDTALMSHQNAIRYFATWLQENGPSGSTTPLPSLLDHFDRMDSATDTFASQLETHLANATLLQNTDGPQLCTTYQQFSDAPTRAWVSLGDSTCSDNAELLTAVQSRVTKQLIISRAEQ